MAAKHRGEGAGHGYRERPLPKTYENALGEFIALSPEVFEREYGAGWNTQRAAKELKRMDFSGKSFRLETLLGPEGGLMHETCKNARYYVEVLVLTNNQLTDINCLDKRTPRGEPEFRNLTILVAARNQLNSCTLSLTSLLELNLAHNLLELMPITEKLPNLQKLILHHNRIDDTLKQLGKNKKLKEVYLHDNNFSWKPTAFERELAVLDSVKALNALTLWPNPFAKNFREYQFLTVTRIETLQVFDGYEIDDDLRAELRDLASVMRDKNALDYAMFDIKVSERSGQLRGLKAGDTAYSDHAHIPKMESLVELLDKPLDHPNSLIKYVYQFEQQVDYLWKARYRDRVEAMNQIKDPTQLELQINAFADKMQQILGRFDSAQDTLVKCLVRMCASGNALLSRRCAQVLAEWVDAMPPELRPELQTISATMFGELRSRMLAGMQSIQDDPNPVFQISNQGVIPMNEDVKEDLDNGFFGEMGDIAESAEILGALRAFGRPGFVKKESPNRAIVLRPLLPALCRHSRKALGKEQPRDDVAPYKNFTFFHGAEVGAEIKSAPKDGFIDTCLRRCATQNFSGFVVEDVPGQPGMQMAKFLHETSDAIRYMRVPAEGKTLYAVPAVTVDTRGSIDDVFEGECRAWHVWHNCLNVLVVVTADKYNSAQCISTYGLHKIVVEHESTMFTENRLTITHEATLAFTSLLHLVKNLMCATPTAAQIARSHFTEQKLHIRCWDKVRRRLAGGAARHAKSDQMMLLSTLVEVVFEMSRGSLGAAVMRDLADGADDVLTTMLDVASDTEVPDPLLLASALETLWMFLADEETRSRKDANGERVVTRVLAKLHQMSILLPYLRGPYVKDTNNNKYQNLWRRCELTYGDDKYCRDRIPQLADETGKYGDWRSKVPDIKDQQNALMNRVLLGIVRLMELFSTKEGVDRIEEEFQRVTEMLDSVGREKLLIGPSTGLVLCPDFDVKIEVLKVVQHVLRNTPDQFESNEMGWLTRYLAATCIGVGRQEDFLAEVLKLTKILITDKGVTGFTFRQQFAKGAIRQAYDILNKNTARDVKGNRDEEESKNALSLEIVDLLATCSRPLSGGLRPFLRRVDFLVVLKSVMRVEDANGHSAIQEPLLRTWTGRDMREVLIPLVTTNDLSNRGTGRYLALARLADVLQGKADFDVLDNGDTFRMVPTTDERTMWMGPGKLKRRIAFGALEDEEQAFDFEKQQQEFQQVAGLEGILEYCEKMWAGEDRYTIDARERVTDFASNAAKGVTGWWEEARGSTGPSGEAGGPEPDEAPPKVTNLEAYFIGRIRCINLRVEKKYNANLSNSDERTGDSIVILARKLKQELEENQKEWRQIVGSVDWDPRLLEIENEYFCNGRLYKFSDFKKNPTLKLEKVRQPSTNLKELVETAQEAQVQLKRLLLAKGDNVTDETRKWAKDAWFEEDAPDPNYSIRYESGLVEFLKNFRAQVFDPGVRDEEELIRMLGYKYGNDVTRIRDCSRLVVEFESASMLVKCLEEGLKSNTRFSVVTIRNRFKRPMALGRRYMSVLVEVMPRHTKHICELQMVVNPSGRSGQQLERARNLVSVLETELRDTCNIKDRLREIAEYLVYEINSRTIKHMDVVYIEWIGEPSYIVVNGIAVKVSKSEPTQMNLFWVERDAGPGSVRTGDTISLKNFLTNKLVDTHMSNFSIKCRYGDQESERSNTKYVIEAGPEFAEGTLAGLASLIEQDTSRDEAPADVKKPRQPKQKLPPRNVHSLDRLIFRVRGSSSPIRRLSVREGSRWEHAKKLMADPRQEDYKSQYQIFYIHREGSLREFLEDTSPGMRDAEANAKAVASKKTDEQNQENLLMQAYMQANLGQRAPEEGGIFRRKPPNFVDIAHKQATSVGREAAREEEEEAEEEAEALLGSQLNLKVEDVPVMAVAAMSRCIYSCIELAAEDNVRAFHVDSLMSGDVQELRSTMARILSLAVAAATQEDGQLTPKSVCEAWVSAKVLRMLTSLVKHLPDVKVIMSDNGYTAATQDPAKMAEELDRRRLSFLLMLSSYIHEVLVEPMLQRLAVAAHSPLGAAEVTLLADMTSLLHAILVSFLSLELHCVGGAVQHSGGLFGGALALEEVAGLGGGLGEAIDIVGKGTAATGSTDANANGVIPDELKSEIMAALVPPGVVRVLVHTLLYGMRREATAYAAQRTIGDTEDNESVKLVNALVQRCIEVLAIVMFGCQESEDTACEYNICESISQAMAAGTQMVPRARITQLMSEWHTEKHRLPALQKMSNVNSLQLDLVQQGQVLQMEPGPTEKPFLLGFAWQGYVSHAMTFPFKRVLVVLTTQMNVLLFTTSSDGGRRDEPTFEGLTALSIRNLSWVHKTMIHPRLRQFVGLMWERGQSGSQSSPVEVLIFESQSRQNLFRSALRKITRFRTKPSREQKALPGAGGRSAPSPPPSQRSSAIVARGSATNEPPLETGAKRFIPEERLKKQLVLYLRRSAKPRENPRAEAQLVSVTFIRSKATLWSLEAMILTREALVSISMVDFLNAFVKYHLQHEPKEATEFEDDCMLMDNSDSDEDVLPAPQKPVQGEMDDFHQPAAIKGQWQLKKLKGVWFLADAEPRMQVQFDSNPEEIHFFSESGRQRFRQQLRCALTDSVEGAKKTLTELRHEQGKRWRVEATAEVGELPRLTDGKA